MKHIRWFLAVIALCIFAGLVSAVPMVRVETEHIEVSEGDVFAVNITVDPAGYETMGAQYNLYFNNTLLNAVDQARGGFLTQDGASATVYKDSINNTLGIIEYSEARTGGVEYGVTGYGILSTITFKAMEPGTCSLDLSDVRLSDPAAKYITDRLVGDGTCDIGAIGATPTPTLETATPTTTATTTPTQLVETPAVNNQTPMQSPTAPILSTAVQTPAVDQIPSEPASPATAGTARTPVMNTMVPGFEASIAIAGLLTIILSKRRRMMIR